MLQVLMVDDDVELCEMVAEYLGQEGFCVSAVYNGQDGVERAQSGEFSLVLLDVMLPQLSGFEVLRRIRTGSTPGSNVPVLMLTARGNAVDRIVGLEVGADDYLPKPFEERELLARMRAILRRSGASPEGSDPAPQRRRESLRVGDLVVDIGARMVRRGEETIVLTAVEFQMLTLLLRNAGNVVEREQIAHDVLDRKLLPFDRSIDTHIAHLRRKLGLHPGGTERIQTVRGVGYIYTLPPRSSP